MATQAMPSSRAQNGEQSVLASAVGSPRQIVVLFALLAFALAAANARGQAPQGIADTVPSQFYYQAVFDIYRGDYRDAQRSLIRETKNSIRIGVTQRWIDAVCYHAMLGEVYYHQGQPALALEQYDQAVAMYLQYPKFMLMVQFTQPGPDPNIARKTYPWGPGTRQSVLGSIPNSMMIRFGDDFADQQRAVQQGGVLRQMQFWQIDVVEIVRALSTAIRRRNELLGPLVAHDPLSRDLVNKLSSGITPPNHWSNAFADLLLGLAYSGQGNLDQAFTRLQRAERVAGQFDYNLTCISLLEQGRLAMEAGKSDAADRLFFEASVSALYYQDPGVIDEAFRLAAMNRLGASNPAPIPILDVAANWARRQQFDHIFARLTFTRAEEWMIAGDWKQAAETLQLGQSRLQDAATGLLGNWSRYLEARVLTHMGKDTAVDVLNTALEAHFNMSTRFLQLQITNQWFDDQVLRSSAAVEIYNELLSDPSPLSWAFRPLETLALLKAPLDPSFDRWMTALAERKEKTAMLEVSDLAKRRRFFNDLPLGGRLAALRDTLETPETSLSPSGRGMRQDLLMRFPEYADLSKEGESLHSEIIAAWKPSMEKSSQQDLARIWKSFNTNLNERNSIVEQLALSRVPSEFQFPPFVPVADLQARLLPGQAVVVFHETGNGLMGFLVTDRGSTIWNCGPTAELSKNLGAFLRDLGNHDRNNALDEKQLASTDWLESGQALYQTLFEGSSLDPVSMKELIVVPDGLVWYVPLSALPVKLESGVVPLVTHAQIRVVPTMGLAVGYSLPWRRIQHTAIVGRQIVPGDTDDDREVNLAKLMEAMPNLIDLPTPLPAPTPVIATALDAVVVLDEFDLERQNPWDWSPLPVGRESGDGTLDAWLDLPRIGPQRMIFAGAHTVAENGGKTPRRKKDNSAPGSELFLASCALVGSGAQTVLLSRWNVRGQSTLEIMREFVQELPRTSAPDAWQRCVAVAKELQLEPDLEPRIKLKAGSDLPTAAHPFFWAGYLLIDCGEPFDEDLAAEDAVADDAAAAPVVPPVPVAQ
jgi:tetratricopeptide (TPR) repeat protein